MNFINEFGCIVRASEVALIATHGDDDAAGVAPDVVLLLLERHR